MRFAKGTNTIWKETIFFMNRQVNPDYNYGKNN